MKLNDTFFNLTKRHQLYTIIGILRNKTLVFFVLFLRNRHLVHRWDLIQGIDYIAT